MDEYQIVMPDGTPMEYAEQLPKYAGWYWVRHQGESYIVRIYVERRALKVEDHERQAIGYADLTVKAYQKANRGVQWAGPIPEPQDDEEIDFEPEEDE